VAPASRESAEPAHYKLHGVLYHHGESVGSGYYTVDVLRVHPNGDIGSGESWLHIDNEALSAVRHDDASGNHADEWEDNQCACMLYYCRTTSTQI
jgi:ubiquitin carboxyl-terminal hydrolase 10